MKKIILLFVLIAAFSSVSTAQKYGHINFGNLIAAMPETKSANSDLEAYQKQLVTKGEEMAKKFQEDYGAFVTAVQGGDLTPVQQQERQAALQAKQQEIMAYEQEVVEKVQKKREELLKPIIDKAEQSVQEIAKANDYVFIFDTSIYNAILFAKESEDVMGQVKTKLGLQ